ncbi:MAG: hypothetical protein AB7S36_17535 [Planctomycetota bacterium]
MRSMNKDLAAGTQSGVMMAALWCLIGIAALRAMLAYWRLVSTDHYAPLATPVGDSPDTATPANDDAATPSPADHEAYETWLLRSPPAVRNYRALAMSIALIAVIAVSGMAGLF